MVYAKYASVVRSSGKPVVTRGTIVKNMQTLGYGAELQSATLKEQEPRNPPMNSKSDTIDEILEQLDKEYDYNNYHSGLRTAKAKLQALILRERKAELERLFDANNGVMGSHYIYLTDDAADEIAKALRNRIAELSRLSGEESHE